MELIFHPAAGRDAREIAARYAAISAALEERFWKELDACIDDLAEFPERHHFDPSGFRRSNLPKFPYHILFEVRLGWVRVMVIRHHHRDPAHGLRRR